MSDTVELVVREGNPDHSRARRLFDADVAAKFALLCTALPQSDCWKQVCASLVMLEHMAAHDEPPGNATRHD
ncbi:hypothetical protein HUG10_04750 [Halorarum halophilum]|uniref:Uncharacterized protein n=1 Tax=Halorarum halophilum TaxID=2743090 RepID=A0A7D5GGL2_9EURY|nr:hypothetical protein [Halobaculum halophilum]QLG26891.1 hypothetical protein HUG10_04750 [Halobaculum halophilum]